MCQNVCVNVYGSEHVFDNMYGCACVRGCGYLCRKMHVRVRMCVHMCECGRVYKEHVRVAVCVSAPMRMGAGACVSGSVSVRLSLVNINSYMHVQGSMCAQGASMCSHVRMCVEVGVCA